MRGVLIAAFAALLTTAVLAPRPASALPAKAALNYSHTNGDLIEVKRWYKRRYYRPYRYRPNYYRPYRYYRPYAYRPYRYYRPYYRPYWRRPGVSIWFGW